MLSGEISHRNNHYYYYYIGRDIDGFHGFHGGLSIDGRMQFEFCNAKHLCIDNTWPKKADTKMITYGSGCNKSVIDFCMMKKVDRKILTNVIVINGELQHNLVIVDIERN